MTARVLVTHARKVTASYSHTYTRIHTYIPVKMPVDISDENDFYASWPCSLGWNRKMMIQIAELSRKSPNSQRHDESNERNKRKKKEWKNTRECMHFNWLVFVSNAYFVRIHVCLREKECVHVCVWVFYFHLYATFFSNFSVSFISSTYTQYRLAISSNSKRFSRRCSRIVLSKISPYLLLHLKYTYISVACEIIKK